MWRGDFHEEMLPDPEQTKTVDCAFLFHILRTSERCRTGEPDLKMPEHRTVHVSENL